jgi:hypothetical protein
MLVAGMGICLWMAVSAFAGQAGADGPHVTSVKLKVAVDRSSNCKLALSASIGASAMGTIWYRFAGPAGVTFDFGDEDTKTLAFDTSFGAGRGTNMRQDIHGEFRVEAAMVDASGKHGSVVSDTVRADYTCGNGSAIASPLPAGSASKADPVPTPSTQSGPTGNSAFQVTAVKIAGHTENFNGACPTNDMAFRWEVSANGSGAAVVRFMQESRPIREETVAFAAAGTKVVTYRATGMGAPGGHYQGWIGLQVLSPNKMTAGHEAYTMQCAPRAK